MKSLTLFCLGLILLLAGCKSACRSRPLCWSYCKQAISILNSESENPKFEINFDNGSDSIRKELNLVFDETFWLANSIVDVRVPLTFDWNDIFLDVSLVLRSKLNDTVSYQHTNQPEYLVIIINGANELLINYSKVPMHMIGRFVRAYFNQIGTDDDFPKNYAESKVIIKVDKCQRSFFDQVLANICYGYLGALDEKMEQDFCDLKKKNIKQLKEEFPLNIVVQLYSENINPEYAEMSPSPGEFNLNGLIKWTDCWQEYKCENLTYPELNHCPLILCPDSTLVCYDVESNEIYTSENGWRKINDKQIQLNLDGIIFNILKLTGTEMEIEAVDYPGYKIYLRK